MHIYTYTDRHIMYYTYIHIHVVYAHARGAKPSTNPRYRDLGEGHVDPAGEAVLLIPLAFPVAHQNQRVVSIFVKPRVAIGLLRPSYLRRRRRC